MQEKINNIVEKIYVGEDARIRLKEFGINVGIITQVVESGLLQKSNCTKYNTKPGPGIIQWDETVRALRSSLCPSGWKVYNDNGVEGVENTKKQIRIIPSSGNAATGNPKQTASNKNAKGSKGIEIIEKSLQLSLFGQHNATVEKKETINTYILLYYNTNKELRLELSKPSYINKKGMITNWEERIILDSRDLSEPIIKEKEYETEDSIDIPIEKKYVQG